MRLKAIVAALVICVPLTMWSILCILLTTAVASLIMCSLIEVSDSDDYLWKRNLILKAEKTLSLGGSNQLSAKENEVNKLILKEKNAELLRAYENVSEFLPLQHFFHVKDKIETSKVFSILKKVPKGASLHTHLLAAVSVDYIMENITYRENIYGCFLNGTFKLRFLLDASQDTRCRWKQLKEYRKENANFDKWLRKQLSLEVENPFEEYASADVIWQRFKKIFTTAYDMLCYKPVFQDYIYQMLEELYTDNVMYTELRGTFMPLYELNGTTYDTKGFFDIFIETVAKFKTEHPKFVGVRYIHSIYRGVTPDILKSGLKELIKYRNLYPNFIAGFDFVGYEEEGRQIVGYHQELLEVRTQLKFFFHAGETNWNGYTDLNLVDALLLNCSRVGHGFGLPKHPVLLDMVKSQNISVEVCPISNQVLMLNQDPRNHPAAFLIANGFPVVICNDDPSVWGASGLSYDWYIVFMAMTSKNSGIEVLKQFAIDSISYSAMTDGEKSEALEQWRLQWDEFLDKMLM